VVKLSRQGYYKERRRRKRQRINEELICTLVRRERCLQPKLGTRKLLGMLRPELADAGISIGRDRFFMLLKCHRLLIPKARARAPVTTDSRHRFREYRNLLKELELTAPHQAWVSDLTYVRTEQGFVYVSLVSDAYSRAIVGFDAADQSTADGPLRALDQAIRQLPTAACPVHHSDRGVQYCCNDYHDRLGERGLWISRTEDNHCYENAQAERLNGILKQEYGLGQTFGNKAQVRAALKQAVYLFNHRRPHTSLGYQIPAQVHNVGWQTFISAGTPVALRAPSVPAKDQKNTLTSVNF